MRWFLSRLRSRAYRAGRRPQPGTLLYSPSLAMIYAFRDGEADAPFKVSRNQQERK